VAVEAALAVWCLHRLAMLLVLRIASLLALEVRLKLLPILEVILGQTAHLVLLLLLGVVRVLLRIQAPELMAVLVGVVLDK
jgi:hypothetical protein